MAPDAWVSAAEIAEWVGLHERQVRKLAERQVVERDGKGQYRLKTTVQAITVHLREQAAGRAGAAPDGLDLVQERAALARAQRIAQEAKNDLMLRQIVTHSDMERVIGPLLHSVRTAFLAVPSNAAPRLAACKTPQEAFAVLTDLVRDVLTKLSETELVVEQIKDQASGEFDA